MGFCASWCLRSENFWSCGKKQKVRFGIISNTKMNATKALRLKGSQSSVFYIFPSVEAWNIGEKNRSEMRKQPKNGLSLTSWDYF